MWIQTRQTALNLILLMKRGIVLSLITTLRRICFNTFKFNCLKMFFAPTHTLNPTKSSLIP